MQLTLDFEPGLALRYASARECLATQVYQRGLVAIAGKCDLAPSKLTEKLAGMRSDGRPSGVTLDELERYVTATGDTTVIQYLAAKFCRDPKVVESEALSRVHALLEQLAPALDQAGLTNKRRRA